MGTTKPWPRSAWVTLAACALVVVIAIVAVIFAVRGDAAMAVPAGPPPEPPVVGLIPIGSTTVEECDKQSATAAPGNRASLRVLETQRLPDTVLVVARVCPVARQPLNQVYVSIELFDRPDEPDRTTFIKGQVGLDIPPEGRLLSGELSLTETARGYGGVFYIGAGVFDPRDPVTGEWGPLNSRWTTSFA